jgi:acylglycerol lipase
VEHQEGAFTGARDASIYYQCWLPDGEAKAMLLIVHGFGEHCGRYRPVVDHFVPRGYAVYAFDHIGHGRSEGTRAHVQRFSDYTDTLHTFVGMVQRWQPEIPLFLIGHSLGGLIVADYVLDHASGLAGAVLSGPVIAVPENITPVTVAVGKVLSALAPQARIAGIEAEGISRDPDIVQAYIEDPLVYRGKMTARLGAEALKTQQRVMAEASTIELPLLIIHGGADVLAPPAGSRECYEAVSSADKTLKVYEGLYHETYHEPEREQVLGDMQAWLEAHLQEDGPGTAPEA